MLFFRAFLLVFLLSASAFAQDTNELEHEPYDAPQQQRPAPTHNFKCSDYKTKCGEMRSCAEAQFFLKECGVLRLDRDRDGMACETLCRH